MEFLPPDREIFRRCASLGEALQIAVKAAWPWNTANHIQRRWGIEPSTAETACKGGASARTVVKALRAEGDGAWELWDALGELLIGESREDFDERQFHTLLTETARARERLEDRRRRRLKLEAGAARFGEVAGR